MKSIFSYLSKMLEDSIKKKRKMNDETLRFFYEMSKKEVDFLRDRQYKIFIWFSTILLTIIGLVMISEDDRNLLFDFSIIANKWIFSIIVGFIALMSMYWIYRNRSWHRDHMIIITKIGKVLNAYEKDNYLNSDNSETLFPEKWLNHNKEEQLNLIRKIFSSDYIVALIILTLFTLASIWVY